MAPLSPDQPKKIDSGIHPEMGGVSVKINSNERLAVKNGIHIDVAVSPFLTEEQRTVVLHGKAQDPEWD